MARTLALHRGGLLRLMFNLVYGVSHGVGLYVWWRVLNISD